MVKSVKFGYHLTGNLNSGILYLMAKKNSRQKFFKSPLFIAAAAFVILFTIFWGFYSRNYSSNTNQNNSEFADEPIDQSSLTPQAEDKETTLPKKSYPIGSTVGWKSVKNNGITFQVPPGTKCNDDSNCTMFNFEGKYIPERINVEDYNGGSRRQQFLGPSPFDCHYIYQDATFGNVSALLIAGDGGWCEQGVGGSVVVLGNKFITYDVLSYDPSTKEIEIEGTYKSTIISTLKLAQ